MRGLLFRGVLLALVVLPGAGARAQIGGGAMSGPSARPVTNVDPDNALPQKAPRAVGLPGAQSDPDAVAPRDRPPSEMRPTEGLFDAINRGDIAAARDAVSRGAELNAHNILGMTPVEQAVDLGRRDIAFLLLSLRGLEGRPEPRPAQPSAQSAAEQARAARAEAQRQEAQRRAAARVAPQPGPAVPQGPKLFAGDGGAPAPDAGFLGFGGATGRAR